LPRCSAKEGAVGELLAVRTGKTVAGEAQIAPRQLAETTVARVHEVLTTFSERDPNGEVLTAVRRFPARAAEWADWPAWVQTELRAAYQSKGIARPYSHQALAAEAVHAEKNVVIVTPTASGKTLCYNLPVINAILENEDTRALYLFPTKALAQDQLAELYDVSQRLETARQEIEELRDAKGPLQEREVPARTAQEAGSRTFGVFTYDGDTPNDARKAIREKGHIV